MLRARRGIFSGSDIVPPTVVISSTESGTTTEDPIPITITFDESVSGFAIGDITEVNCTLDNFVSTANPIFTVEATPTARAITIDVAAGVCTDGVGNDNTAATQFSINAAVTDVPQAEADALIAFYNATGGASWTDKTNWVSGLVVDDWYGITVSGGHVDQIDVSGNNVVGAAASTLDPLAATLDALFVYGNNISTLDVSSLTDLEKLYCYNNASLSALDVSALTKLDSLRCYSCDISTLDVSSLTLLEYLDCHGNSISTLDVSALVKLVQLRCQTNEISVVDVSLLTSLQYLFLQTNTISVVDLSDLVALQNANISDNSMTEAEVDTIVQAIYDNWAAYTDATPVLNISGTNAAPSGTYQDGDPPTTGKEYIYEIVEDPESTGNEAWVVTFTGQ